MLLSRGIAVGAALLIASCTLGEPTGERLSGGELHCPAGTKTCGRACVGLDVPSVGCALDSCEPCSLPHASASCMAGACAVSACQTGWRDCDGNPANGCEEETESCGCRSVEFATPNASILIGSEGMGFGDGDWTWEAWVKFGGEATTWLFYSNGEGKEYDGIGLGIQDGSVSCGITKSSSQPAAATAAPGFLRLHEWQHVACERSGSSVRLYIDGYLRATGGVAEVIRRSNATLYNGPDLDTSPVKMGPMRISRVARYDGDFEPKPRWVADDDAVLLYLVNRGVEGIRLADEAGGDNTGTLNNGMLDGKADTPCGP